MFKIWRAKRSTNIYVKCNIVWLARGDFDSLLYASLDVELGFSERVVIHGIFCVCGNLLSVCTLPDKNDEEIKKLLIPPLFIHEGTLGSFFKCSARTLSFLASSLAS